jgi:RimJ/RimL family protein N-acetyltransferase
MSSIQPREIPLKTREKIVVRSVLPEDTRSFHELSAEIVREREYMITLPEELLFTEEQEHQWLGQHHDSPRAIFLLAFAPSMLVGYLHFACEERRRRAHSGTFGMAVRKEWREKGVGRALLQTLLEWARDNPDVEKVWLEVFATNSRGIHLYQSLGFVEEGRLSKEIQLAPGHYVDLVFMSRFVK